MADENDPDEVRRVRDGYADYGIRLRRTKRGWFLLGLGTSKSDPMGPWKFEMVVNHLSEAQAEGFYVRVR